MEQLYLVELFGSLLCSESGSCPKHCRMVNNTVVLSITKIRNATPTTFLDASRGDSSSPWAGNFWVGILGSAVVSTMGILGESERIRPLIKTI